MNSLIAATLVLTLLLGANGKAIEETVDESSFELDVQDILQKRGIVSTMTISDPSGWKVTFRGDNRCGPNFPVNGEPSGCNPSGFPCCSPVGWCGNTEAHCDCPTCIKYTNPGAKKSIEFETERGFDESVSTVLGQPDNLEKRGTTMFTLSDPSGWKVTFRGDYRCGPLFPVNGKPAGCNPTGFPCCSPSGWCGNTKEHCTCQGCTRYMQPGVAIPELEEKDLTSIVLDEEKALDQRQNIITSTFVLKDKSGAEVSFRGDLRCGGSFPVNGKPSGCNPSADAPCCSTAGWCGKTEAHCKCLGCSDFSSWPADGR